ncbi:hypothetical protein ACIP4T_32185 [Streptomyces massasporeus]|uniref:hypothetical protein n=1 Tax=Streptomyces massasporeus TaxID=67324 RepID=UPI0036E0153C
MEQDMLRAGTTRTDAIDFLDRDLVAGSLNDVSIRIPHFMATGADGEAEMRAVPKRYDESTWQAAEELNRRFSDQAIAGQLRAGRYQAILTAPLGEARRMMYAELGELRGYFRTAANRVRAMQERYGRAGAGRGNGNDRGSRTDRSGPLPHDEPVEGVREAGRLPPHPRAGPDSLNAIQADHHRCTPVRHLR